MSLQVLYSFDHIASANLGQLPRVVGIGGGGCTISPSEGRGISGCLVVTENIAGDLSVFGLHIAIDPNNQITIGAWVIIEATPAANGILIAYGNPAAAAAGLPDKIITLTAEPDGSLRVWGKEPTVSGGALIATSPPGVINYGPGQAHYIEMLVTVATPGNVTVRVDGAPVINIATIVTQYTSVLDVTYISLANPAGSNRTLFDDVYINDGVNSGDGWIGFKGVLQVDGKLVNAAGEVTQWIPTTPNGVNFGNVGENTPDVTTFNSATTVGLIDLYNLEDVTYAPIVIQVDFLTRKTGGGVSSVSPVLRAVPGGVNTIGTAQALATAYKYFKQTYVLNPAGGGTPWTMASYNQIQVGLSKVE